jgi:hypothetical protein
MSKRTAATLFALFLSLPAFSLAGNYRVAATLSAGSFAEDGSEFGTSIAADGEWLLVGPGGQALTMPTNSEGGPT